MHSRVAMIACTIDHVTPWMPCFGGERRIRILHLGEGESIMVEDTVSQKTYSECGEFPYPLQEKFRVTKQSSIGYPTSVEVIYDG